MSPASLPNGTTPAQPPKIAAIYARVSTEDQGRGFSLPTQIEGCQRCAQQSGYLVPPSHILVDDGLSGTTLERPGLRTLRDLVQTRSIAAIIVYDPDRLSRNLGHQLLLTEEAEHAGVTLCVVSHPLEQGPEGWLFFQMRGALAEYERAKILERTRRGAVGRISAGHPWGGAPPLGYRYIAAPHAGRWEVDAEEAALVQRIFAMCLSGLSTRAIARTLTAERVPMPSDRNPKRTGGKRRVPAGVWSHRTIRGILVNETYVGTAYWGKYETVTKTTRRARPASEWIAFTVDPIIDAATFEAAQAALKHHKLIAPRNRKHEYLFVARRLRCGRCGRSMRGFWRRGDVRYYMCSSHQNVSDPALRCSGSLRADVVEPRVWEVVERILDDPALLATEVARQEATVDEDRAAVRHELALIVVALTKCEREDTRWFDAYVAEAISEAELKAFRAEILARRQSLLEEQARCEAKLEAIGQATGQVRGLVEHCALVKRELQTFDMAEKRRALDAFDITVRWTPGNPFDIKGCIPLDSLVGSAPGWNAHNRTFTFHLVA